MKIKIIRQIDELGKLAMPSDLHRHYRLKPGDKVCFTACDDGILIHSEEQICNNDNNKEK